MPELLPELPVLPVLPVLPFGTRVIVSATVTRVRFDPRRIGGRYRRLSDPRDVVPGEETLGDDTWPGAPIPAEDGGELPAGVRIRLRRLPLPEPTVGIVLDECVRYDGERGTWLRAVRLIEVALPPIAPQRVARIVPVYQHDLTPIAPPAGVEAAVEAAEAGAR